MKFSRIVFRVAGIYGLIVVLPQYFTESLIGRKFPPPVTHPEYYYGFVGAVVVWHILFLLISSNPVRYRPMMLVSALEKLAFGVPGIVLYLQNRVAPGVLGGAIVDLFFGVLFLLAFQRTPQDTPSRYAEPVPSVRTGV